MKSILLLNGPNLSTLGIRKPEIYGTLTLHDIEKMVEEEIAECGWKLISIQDDGERELIHALRKHSNTLGAIINPGALMIAGWSLRDALETYPSPWIEVHISNIAARESFRHSSILSPLAKGIIVGFGPLGYKLAAQALKLHLNTPAMI